MNRKVNQISMSVSRKVLRVQYLMSRYWFRSTILMIFVYSIIQKDIQIYFNFNQDKALAAQQVRLESASMFNPDFSNQGAPAAKAMDEKDLAKIRRQKRYIAAHEEFALTEMDRYGIPASITLAQGLLESDAGDSRLALKNNNHFGIKCFSKTCKKGHCSNFTDDTHKDFFRIYSNVWESYRAHSKLLSSSRYRHLLAHHPGEEGTYRDWAYGLQKAGYATDPRYAEKLIQLIEQLKLYQMDQKYTR